MGSEHLGTNLRWNQPVSCNRHAVHQRGMLRLLLLPARKVHGSRKWRHHHELSEGQVRLQRHLHRSVKRFRRICRKAEDERTKDVDTMLLKGLQPLRQGLAGAVEIFEYRFESFWRYRLDSHQRALDIGFSHG